MGNLIYLGDFRLSGRRIQTIGNHCLVETLILFLLYVCVIAPKILGRLVLLNLADLCLSQLTVYVPSCK